MAVANSCNFTFIFTYSYSALSFVAEFYVKLNFSKSSYSFEENKGSAKITLILSKAYPSSFNLLIISAALIPTLTEKGECVCMCVH